MNIAIVGAGSIGVATAHALAQAGHEVTVYERHGTAAEEASFGHAGWLGPSPVSYTHLTLPTICSV